MYRSINKKLGLFLILVLCFLLSVSTLTLTGLAADESETMNFTIDPDLSIESQNASSGYFDIATNVNEIYDLQVEVVNKSPNEAIYEVELTNAVTSNIGEVSYEISDLIDETLTYPLTSLSVIKEIKDGETFKLAGNSTGTLNIQITAPSETYKGIILGGLRVKDITARLERESRKAETEGSGVKIYQEFQAVIAIKLQGDETGVAPDFKLVEVRPDVSNYRASIVAEIRNTEPVLIKDAIFSAQITPKGSNEFIFKTESLEVDFAPNSVMSYNFVDDLGIGLKAGTYLFEGTLTFEDKVWEFSQEFVIEEKKAEEINDTALNQNQQAMVGGTGIPTWLLIVILVALVLIIALLILVLLIFSKKKKMDRTDTRRHDDNSEL